MGNDLYGQENFGQWIDDTNVPVDETNSGLHLEPTTPQPSYDKDEPWSELPPLKKVAPAAVFALVEALRAAGIPVLSPGARSAGIFSGGRVNVTLSVPDRLRAEAMRIQARFFPYQ